MRRLWIIIALIASLATPANAVSLLGLKNSLVQFALEQISIPGEMEITAEGVEETGDGATDLVGLVVADGEGPWLTVERISLRWSPSRILRGELAITRLAASGVEVLRSPDEDAAAIEAKPGSALAETDDDPFDWPRSPIPTLVEEVALERVRIAAGVIAAQSLSFDATGRLRDQGDEQALRLNLRRTDAVSGRIDIDYLRDFAADRLDLTLTADEARGGLVAELAGFPKDSASRLRLAGAGPVRDWALDFAASADRVFEAEGAARLRALDRLSAEADFTLTPGASLSPAVRRALAPNARLRVDIAEDEAGVVQVRAAELTATDLSAKASGSFDRASGMTDLALVLRAEAGLSELVDGAEFRGLTFEGRAFGPAEDLKAEGRLDLDGLATAPLDVGAASLDARIGVTPGVIDFSLGGRASGVRLDRMGPALFGEAELSAEGAYSSDALTLDAFRLKARSLDVAASGEADLAAGTARLDYRAAAPDLAPVAAAYGAEAAGAAEVKGALSGPLDAPRLRGEAAFTALEYDGEPFGEVALTHDATLGEEPFGVLGVRAGGSRFGPATVDTAFRLADGALALSDLSFSALGVSGDGAGTLDMERFVADGRVAASTPDMASLSAVAGVDLAGPASVETTFRLTDGALALSDLRFSALGVSGDGGATLDLERLVADGRLAIAAPDLSTLSSLAGLDLAGAAEADLRLSAPGAAQEVRYDLRLSQVRVGPAAVRQARLNGTAALPEAGPEIRAEVSFQGFAADAVAVAEGAANVAGGLRDLRIDASLNGLSSGEIGAAAARLDARIRDAAGDDPAIDATLNVTEATVGPALIDGLSLTAAGRLSALELAVLSEGAWETGEPFTLAADGRFDLAGPPQGTVTRFDAAIGDAGFALRREMRIASAEGVTRLSPLDLSLPGGALTGEFAFGAGVSGDIALSLADAAPMAALAGLPLSGGAVEAKARFDTSPRRAGAELSLNAKGLRPVTEFADTGALDIEAGLNWDGRRADLDASISGPFPEPMRARLSAPLIAGRDGAPSLPPSGALSGAIDWAGDIGDLWALVPAPGHILVGATRVALTLGGMVSDPVVSGDVSIDGGRYENLDLGTIITDLKAQSRIGADGGFVVELTGQDGAGAPITATVAIAGDQLDAQIRASNATLVRRDDVTASATVDIAARGPLTAPDIAGDILIERAEIRLVDALPPGVADLGEVRIKGEPIKPPPPPSDGEIGLDITVRAPQDIFVRGRGLDSEWSADLRIAGTAADPRIVGVAEKRRGTLNLIGAQFELKRGEVRFTGGRGVDPTLDIALLTERDGVTGGIQVTGPARDPEIEMVSTPSLPQEEVLPRVMFGRSRQSLSPAEAVTLAAGVATLFDGGGGAVDSVRSAIGVDVLALEGEGENTSVTVGSNVADGVFVGVTQPVGGEPGKVRVEVELFENFNVDSEVGQTTGASIGLNWRKDF